ncbi:MAG TPA: hypothetical protein VFV53_01015 [Candidatus Limnocylindrales bacterium]|nr:hypothetical protein [Candidatus Limnocylindrales bacterium]
MTVPPERLELPGSVWLIVGGSLLVELGCLAAMAQLGQATATPESAGVLTLALFLLGLGMGLTGASAIALRWTIGHRLVAMVLGGVALLLAAVGLGYGASASAIAMLGGAFGFIGGAASHPEPAPPGGGLRYRP